MAIAIWLHTEQLVASVVYSNASDRCDDFVRCQK